MERVEEVSLVPWASERAGGAEEMDGLGFRRERGREGISIRRFVKSRMGGESTCMYLVISGGLFRVTVSYRQETNHPTYPTMYATNELGF